MTPQSGNRVSTSLGNSGLYWTIFAWNRDTAVPAEGNADLQTLICSETQTMSHIVESCPLTKLNGGFSWRYSADEDAVSWLTSYCSWHAYEKKNKWNLIYYGLTYRVHAKSTREFRLTLDLEIVESELWSQLITEHSPVLMKVCMNHMRAKDYEVTKQILKIA